ncbi:MAG: serine hydrolase domain-containing protein [Candidatus Hermodarchaeota archaeon]
MAKIGLLIIVLIVITLVPPQNQFTAMSTYSSVTGLSETTADYWPTTDWLESTPEEQGMNSTKLNQVIDYINDLNFAIDSVVVVRHGYIVLEEYFNPSVSNQSSLHFVYSVTKSFTSALIGIAIQKGFIENVDQKVVDLFSNRIIANLDSRKQNMTIEHLLTMSTGLEWDEWTYSYDDSRNDVIKMIYSSDSVQFILDRLMVNDPGEEWVYSSGASHLLSAIIEQTTNYNTLEFANEFLFGPLGITDVDWWQDPQGIYYGGFGLYLRARDMAKFGYLYLNNGTWDSQQIVSADWVAKSTETAFLRGGGHGYGYQWWTYPQLGIYYAIGLYDQSIFVVPDYNMVVVFTANITSGSNPEHNLLFDYIIPAVINDTNATTAPFRFDILLPTLLIALMIPVIAAVVMIIRTRRR